jgi:hypothetical protein
MSAYDFILTEDELKGITGYSRPAFQERCLKKFGIPCQRRPDNSLIVLRMHCQNPAVQAAANDTPRLKRARK